MDEAVDTLTRAGVPQDEMAALERQLASGPSPAPAAAAPSSSTTPANRMMNFVSAGVEARAESSTQQAAANNEDIELPDEESDEEDDVQIAERAVPEAVFGELGKRAAESREESSSAQENNEQQLGALERIKRRRQ